MILWDEPEHNTLNEQLEVPSKALTQCTVYRNIVSCPDPTHKGRGSGYTSPISWASGRTEAL